MLVKILVLCLTIWLGTGLLSAQDLVSVHRQFFQRLASAVIEGEMKGKPVDVFMREEKIALLEGRLTELGTLCADTAVAMELTLVDGRRYAVSFVRDGQRRLTLSYPADYQLIAGITMMDMEDRLYSNIAQMPIPSVAPVSVDESRLRQIGNGPVWMMEGGSYMLPELTGNRYYVKESDGGFGLLYSEDMPLESMANLITGEDIDASLNIEVLLVKYGYRSEMFTVPLRQFVAYCLAEGCTPYYGVISQEVDKVVCEVVMYNEQLGYAHVMKLTFDPQELGKKGGTVSARLNSYVPLANVKAIFEENENE